MKAGKLARRFGASRQVFVCNGKSCGRKAGRAMRKAIRQALKQAGHKKDVRVMQCSCLGLCGEGVNAVVYPGPCCLMNTTVEQVVEMVLDKSAADSR